MIKVFNDVDFQHNKLKNADIEGLADVAISGSYTDLDNTPDVPDGISLSLNTSTYEITATLKKGNTTIATSTAIDLPLETMVVSGSYDSTNKKVILTLKNGQTVEFSVADLVDGLVATSDLASVAFSGDYDDLLNKPSIADAQIPSDWNQTDSTKKDYIKNKPTIPDAQIQSDWDQSDNTKKDYIKNKPTIPAAQIQSDWSQSDNTQKDFIKNKPTIPAAQIQSDWSQSDNLAKDFIKNKPTIPAAQIQSDWNQTDTTAKDFIKNKPNIGGGEKQYNVWLNEALEVKTVVNPLGAYTISDIVCYNLSTLYYSLSSGASHQQITLTNGAATGLNITVPAGGWIRFEDCGRTVYNAEAAIGVKYTI